jgi:hypothetical protein
LDAGLEPHRRFVGLETGKYQLLSSHQYLKNGRILFELLKNCSFNQSISLWQYARYHDLVVWISAKFYRDASSTV